jgi:hypothetical protein
MTFQFLRDIIFPRPARSVSEIASLRVADEINIDPRLVEARANFKAYLALTNGELPYPSDPHEVAEWVPLRRAIDSLIGATFAYLETRAQFEFAVADCAATVARSADNDCTIVAEIAKQTQPISDIPAIVAKPAGRTNVAPIAAQTLATIPTNAKPLRWSQSLADIEDLIADGRRPSITALASRWRLSVGAASRRVDKFEDTKSIRTEREGKVRVVVWAAQRAPRERRTA